MREPLIVHTGEPDMIESGEQTPQVRPNGNHQVRPQENNQHVEYQQPGAAADPVPVQEPRDRNGARPRYRYPNGVLDPNVDVTLNRAQRRRESKRIYNAATGQWIRIAD